MRAGSQVAQVHVEIAGASQYEAWDTSRACNAEKARAFEKEKKKKKTKETKTRFIVYMGSIISCTIQKQNAPSTQIQL